MDASSPIQTSTPTAASTNPPRVKPKANYKINWPRQIDDQGKKRVTKKKPIVRKGWTVPRTEKPFSKFLNNWLHDAQRHGYEFREDVLLGWEEDEDYDTRFPNNWAKVASALRNEVNSEVKLLKLDRTNPNRNAYNREYHLGCKKALREVKRYYM